MTRRTTTRRRGAKRGSGRSRSVARARSVVRGRFLTRLGIVLGAIAAVGIAYVWLMNETYQMGFTIEGMRGDLKALRDRNQQLELRVYALESPGEIARRVQEFGLELALPDDRHTVLVWEPADNVIDDQETRLARLR